MRTLYFFIFLIIGTSTLSAQSDAHKVGYIYPAFELRLDTNQWAFDTEVPSFLQVSGYFKKREQSLTYQPMDLKIKLRVIQTIDGFRTSDLDTISNKNFHKVYKNLYSTYSPEHMLTSYYLAYDAGYIIFVEANKSLTLAEHESAIKTLANALVCIGSEAMDKIAGYPLPSNANEDSLRAIRKAACYRQEPSIKNDFYIDHLLLLDKQRQFSFTEWSKHMLIEDQSMYTEEDLALADAQVRIPKNVRWLKPFMPNHYFHLDDNSYKELRRHIHRKYPDIDYRVDRLTRKGNAHGAAWLINNEDTLRFFNVHLDSTEHISSYDFYVTRTYPEPYDHSATAPLMIGSEPNSRIWNYALFTPDGEIYSIRVDSARLQNQSVEHYFSNTSLHSILHPLKQAVVFKNIEKQDAFDHLIEFENGEKDLLYHYDLVRGKGNLAQAQAPPLGPGRTLRNKKSIQDGKTYPCIKSPILVTDTDKDSMAEYSICFINKGHIIFVDSYELDEQGAHPFTHKSLNATLYSRSDVYEMCSQSMYPLQFRNFEEIYEVTDGMYNDYEGIDAPPVEESMDYYHSVLVPDEYEPIEYPNQSIREAYECDVAAAYVGGESSMQKFIKTNLIIPQEKLEHDLVVYVTITIWFDGHVLVENAMNDNGKIDTYTKAAKDVVAKMPRWTPATIGGQPVKMKKIIPVTFQRK
jgi:hypothetical protein